MKTRIIATGGTLDKVYNEIDGNLTFRKSHLSELLGIVRNSTDIEIETLMLIDSLEIEANHRQRILDRCKSSAEEKIIITHGTDTIIKTASVIAAEKLKKTIVLTGAMIPYSFVKSDASFNLGTAIAAVQTKPYGVYITMNGIIFEWNKVRKNKLTGKFETNSDFKEQTL